MSLSRLALRLATLEALFPSSCTRPDDAFPTVAKNKVFLSAIDPVDHVSKSASFPVAVIYTDDEDGDPGQVAGGPPFDYGVDLFIELSHIAVADDEGGFTVYTPFLDDELETALDVFEAQVVFALLYGPTGKLWRSLTGSRITSLQSNVMRGSEENHRLAIRRLHIKVKVPDDQWNPTPTGSETGLDRLPDPLRTIAKAIAPDSAGGRIVAGIASAVPMMPVLPAFAGATMTLQPASPPAAFDNAKPKITASTPANLDPP